MQTRSKKNNLNYPDSPKFSNLRDSSIESSISRTRGKSKSNSKDKYILKNENERILRAEEYLNNQSHSFHDSSSEEQMQP